nr:cytochrome c3 family protein [Campylobacter blaseri]
MSCMLIFTFSISNDNNTTQVEITKEMEQKYPIKAHHSQIGLSCFDCHENQGNDPFKFKNIGDKGCISCHGDKKRVAKRLQYMDMLKANPHNSVHDGPTLYCDECHYEHKKSTNMCLECHEHEVPRWMGVTP